MNKDEDVLTQKESEALGTFINFLHDDTCNAVRLKMMGGLCTENSQKFDEARDACLSAGLTEEYLVMTDFFTRCATIERIGIVEKDSTYENKISFIVQLANSIYESKMEANKRTGSPDKWVEKCHEYTIHDIKEKENEVRNLLKDTLKNKKINTLSKEDLLKQCEELSIPITGKQRIEIESFFAQHSAKIEEDSIER